MWLLKGTHCLLEIKPQVKIKSSSATCVFGKLRDSLLKDRIVCGLEDNKIRERLLSESNLTLSKCVEICRAALSTRNHDTNEKYS